MIGVPGRVLLVEGDQDLRVVPWLVESRGIVWGNKKNPLVKIHAYDGIEDLLKPGEIETQLKASGLSALGVMVDADRSAHDRWMSIRSRLTAVYPSLPQTMPPEGLVLRVSGKPVFGAWIMPDNVSRGMLETFLLFLRPQENQKLLALAEEVVLRAKNCNAPFSEEHEDKAKIYSWLAWQRPPGRQLHNAIMEQMLTHNAPCLTSFIDWFSRLYGISVPQQP